MTDPPHLVWRDLTTPGPERILERASELIAFGWCQGAIARDAQGMPTEAWRAEAASWSLLGALVAAADLAPDVEPGYLGALRRALGALADVIDEPSLAEWNDVPARTKAEVLSVLDEASRVSARFQAG